MNIPDYHLDVLRRVQAVAPEALLVGGCLRDTDNSRPVADLDICLPEVNALAAAAEIKKTHPYTILDVDPHYLNNDEVMSSREFTTYGTGEGPRPNVNLIGITRADDCNVYDQAGRVDFGICSVAFNGRELWRSPAYVKDCSNQTFTLIRCPDLVCYQGSMNRFYRIGAKYPGWTLVVPPRFQHFAGSFD